MKELPHGVLNTYALALPRGHAFGMRPPFESWQSDDGLTIGIIRRDVDTDELSIMVRRRRLDQTWVTVVEDQRASDLIEARTALASLLKDRPPEAIPANTAPRPALYDFEGRKPSDAFKVLSTKSHRVAAWMINQLYLSLPHPDKNWAGDFQTGNFHTRLWEAQLLAAFREQGLLVEQPHPSPDFRIQNRLGGEAWVEAVTANPVVPYNHVNTPPSEQPRDKEELFSGAAALRFAKTLGSKLQRSYPSLLHVAGKPFAIAIADFHAPASMVWSREALISYLYGMQAHAANVDGKRVAVSIPMTELSGPSKFPAGLFASSRQSDLSAVIFSNACSIAKLNRVGVTLGAKTEGLRYMRIGQLFDRTPGALEGAPFCLDIQSSDYLSMWPQGSEPWSAEMEVFHNPYARHPLPHDLLPEATHWFEDGGETLCASYYETSVLWSQTMILDEDARIPTLEDFAPANEAEA
ncbi:hypothetical protein [Agrobacterium tumefaciens]|uniref:hypothetical protein n=1 Tax=Agrobacterium tumefaciens TaxID=358 RepID=UPI000555BDD6|nr:hypothetical protein [Agrobacterium tumefaciens]